MSKTAVAARLRHTATRSLLALFVMLLAVPFADAAPIQLTEAQFIAATTGLTTISEDFEGFAPGSYAEGPLTTANGTVTTTGAGEILIGPCAGGDQCLSNFSMFGVRTFSGLPTDTTLWAVDDFVASPLNVFRITVSGNSGVSVFDMTASGVYGFGDPTGLISISFENLGSVGGPFPFFANYGFDDVVTAGPPAVPEPASLTLLGLGLVGMAGRRWRQRKAS